MARGTSKPQNKTPARSTTKRTTKSPVSAVAQKNRSSDPPCVEESVCAVLLDLMCASESDAVRVSAAKVLMDKIRKTDKAKNDKRPHDREQRAAVLQELLGLLTELADAKSCGSSGSSKVDQDGQT